MEQSISQILPEIVNKQELTNYSNKLSVILNETENHILELKYKSKRFSKMTAQEVVSECMVLLLKISVITGWIIPTDEFKDLLIDQLCKKMIESYPNANCDEVEYAFRNRDTQVKDWGKNFNLTLLDEVMLPYMLKRVEISDMEERVKSKPLQIENKSGITDEEMKEWIEDWKIQIKRIENPVLIPVSFYEWLEKKGIIKLSNKEKHEYLDQAIHVRQFNLSEQSKSESEHSESKNLLNEFTKMREAECFTGDEAIRVKELAKKISVFDYLKSSGIN